MLSYNLQWIDNCLRTETWIVLSMSRPNVYGFDFLKADHSIDFAGIDSFSSIPNEPIVTEVFFSSSPKPSVDVSNKSDLEKQYDVIQFLYSHRSSGFLPPNIIHKATGIDLSEGSKDENVVKMILKNSKIRIEEIPDPENPSLRIQTFGYQSKYNHVYNKSGLLAQVNKSKNGIRRSDLLDSYEGADIDIKALLTSGEVLGVRNSEDKDIILFPRGELFLVEMDGHVTLPLDIHKRATTEETTTLDCTGTTEKQPMDIIEGPSKDECYIVHTDVDPTKQLRRGEAVWIGGQWFRCSSAIKMGVSQQKEQPFRAQAPPSVSLRKELSKKNEVDGYVRTFDKVTIPVDETLSPTTITNLMDAKSAWTTLRKLVSSRSGVTNEINNQILSSNATSMNPETLATMLSSASHPVHGINSRRGRVSQASSFSGHRIHGNVMTDTKDTIDPLDEAKKAASDPSLIYSFTRRHGVTLDVRDMYLATQSDVPDSEVDLHNLMVKYKLKDSNEPIRRPKVKFADPNIGPDGKPKKRRYYERKGQRFTNIHLRGSEMGAALIRAAEKQNTGETVGDGGM